MNIDGTNTLAGTKPIADVKGDVKVYPLPHMSVIKDLVPDLTDAYAQYASLEPWLQTTTPAPERERLQSPEERAKMYGLWECVLRSEEHTSELQSLMRTSYAVFCLKKKKQTHYPLD